MSDKNNENDKMSRMGSSMAYKVKKNHNAIAEAIKSPEVKSQLMDFIFGKSEFNPLENLRKEIEADSKSKTK